MLFSVPKFIKGETGFLHRTSTPAPDHLGGLLLNWVPFTSPVYLVLPVPELNAILQMRS